MQAIPANAENLEDIVARRSTRPEPLEIFTMRTTNARGLALFLKCVESHCKARSINFGEVIIKSDIDHGPFGKATDATLWLEVDETGPVMIVRLT